ncbi:hypothetical protein QLL95_gp1206 [Cotonvirus japonicus]|uniref:Uncharacterized protein n=1 Tax=Cotonvirus japonicus TaxID=2811091 RepID=A0ABM7NS45_9VIRU|nr:hypothetical protein QLL95_gp1206 [Cotonvirus japonicus]BCS82917.1 hypothetical protein [Cotonvirus japonicus]
MENSLTQFLEVNPEEQEYLKSSYKLTDDELTFPKATINEKLTALQKYATEFIVEVILRHEKEYYDLIEKNIGREYLKSQLCSTNNIIITAICELTMKFYNKLYHDYQNKIKNGLTQMIDNMNKYTDYGPHVLLDKLFRVTIDVHIEIQREHLIINNEYNYDIYEKSINTEIYLVLVPYNLLNALSLSATDDTGDFIIVPNDHKVFNIKIDKNVEDITIDKNMKNITI